MCVASAAFDFGQAANWASIVDIGGRNAGIAMGFINMVGNFGHAAQDYVGARLAQLKKRLADLSLINMSNIPKDRVAFGSKVVLYDLDRGTEVEYKLVTTEEADLSQGLISTSSPIGRGLMGKRVGDSVKVSTPNGAREFEVRALQTIHEEL